MDDKSSKFEDFIRKRLSEMDDSGDGWDRPDGEVWENAKRQIASSTPHKTLHRTILLSWLIFSFLAAAVIYSTHLIKENNKAHEEFTAHKELTLALLQEFRNKESEQVKEIQFLKSENENLEAENKSSSGKIVDLKKIIGRQSQALANLRNNNFEPHNTSRGLMLDHLTNSTNSPLATEFSENSDLPVLTMMMDTGLEPLPAKVIFPQIDISNELLFSATEHPVRKGRKRFEAGYEYTFRMMKIPSYRDFQGLKSTSGNQSSLEVNIHSHGLNVAYLPFHNWLVRIGFNRAKTAVRQDLNYTFVYDKSKEVTKQDGKTVNTLEMTMSTPYFEERSNMSVEIPKGIEIKTGDILDVNISEFQSFRHLQIPFGIEYIYGNGRLKGLVHGGLQWNKMIFDDYRLITSFTTKTQTLPVYETKAFSKPIPSNKFFSATAGLGLNYQLTKHWHARAAMIYSYYLINDQSSKFSKSDMIQGSLKLGLNYRF